MIRAQVRDALSQSIFKAEQELDKKIPYLAQLLPIVPGFPPNIKLLEQTKEQLEKTLPSIGVRLTSGRPFIISSLTLDSAIGPEFGRDRTIRLLKEQFPNMDEEMYLQAYAAIAGKTLPRGLLEIQSNGETAVDSSLQEDGQVKARVRSYTGRNPTTATVTQPQATAPAEQMLDGDWEVMKQVPAR